MGEDVIVETTNGIVRGYSRRGVFKFKGIPYAAPPKGNLRFKPPAPVEPWSDVLDATNYSPVSIQPPSLLEAQFGEPMPQSEAECLTLNIWTQGLDIGKRPVMFWIHGGGFTTGSGASLDGTRLVFRGDVVVVSINYRLGYLGFLYMPDMPDTTANAGILDMVAALEWVKENIQKFGGDPNNVTIFGESAGGMAVSTLLATPSAKGLFHRAIPQSGAANKFSYNPVSAIKVYEELIQKLGVEKGNIEALRKSPAENFIVPQMDMTEFRASGLRVGPVIEKSTLPVHPLEAISKGDAKDIDVFIGSNLDENKMFLMWNPKAFELSEERLHKTVNTFMRFTKQKESKAKEIIDRYRELRKTPRNITDAILTDFTFRIPSIRLAEEQSKHQKNIYMYLFTWQSPLGGGKFGAMHALELPFVFGLFGDRDIGFFPGRTEETQRLSEQMMDTWIAFARSGNPNHENIPELPPYDKENRATILFDKEVTIEQDPYGNERVAWEGII
ncbi:MAG: carboxylesterase/lipase family protein [Candidatus Lokiarchaeota archaeon]|nr:carboxylesterase/lipase family protein [Candidatus Lokiarchaeota archaeon]